MGPPRLEHGERLASLVDRIQQLVPSVILPVWRKSAKLAGCFCLILSTSGLGSCTRHIATRAKYNAKFWQVGRII